MNKRVYGFDQYKQLVKEGSYKPGFITEYEEGTSIDDLNNDAAPAEDAAAPTEDAIPAEGEAPAEDAMPAEGEAPAEDAMPAEADDTAVATDDAAAPIEDATAGDSTDSQKKLELVSGVLAKYNKFVADGGEIDDSLAAKIDAAYKVLNDAA